MIIIISFTDTIKVEEGVPVDAQTLGRASGVLHRQRKLNTFEFPPKNYKRFFYSRHIGKREADAEALHGSISTTLYNTRISKPVKKVGKTKTSRICDI